MNLRTLASLAWWRFAGLRAGRTLLVLFGAYLPRLGDGVTLVEAQTFALTAALAVVLSLATSFASLPEVDDTSPRTWWVAALDRFARTFGQVIVAAGASAALITDVDWRLTLYQAVAAGLGTVALAILAKLPEAEPVSVPADTVLVQVTPAGEITVGDASPFETGTPVDPSMPVGDIAGPRHRA